MGKCPKRWKGEVIMRSDDRGESHSELQCIYCQLFASSVNQRAQQCWPCYEPSCSISWPPLLECCSSLVGCYQPYLLLQLWDDTHLGPFHLGCFSSLVGCYLVRFPDLLGIHVSRGTWLGATNPIYPAPALRWSLAHAPLHLSPLRMDYLVLNFTML